MIFGADTQNKNLADSAKKRIDTSPRTRTSNAMSARIANSKQGSPNESTVSNQSRSTLSKSKSDPIRGSREGLMDGVSTPIQASGDGYDNKDFQGARYKDKSSSAEFKQDIANKFRTNTSKNAIINNQRSRFGLNSSAHLLSEHLKADTILGK